MKTKTVLAAAILSLVPAALIAAAANTSPPASGHWGEHGVFKSFDTNGDGVVTKEEAQAAANARVDKIFADLDTNHDGQITQEEVQAARAARRAEMEAKFAARFKQADTNGDGQLSKDEVQAGMPMLARGFDRLDSNKDGELSMDEIKAGREAMTHRMRGAHGWRGHGPAGATQPDATQPAPPL
jgi:Ca2+-binding EF-hand superfamily protein